MFKISAFIIDDDLSTCIALLKLLSGFEEVEKANYEVNPHNAIQKLLDIQPDMLFLDVQMPTMTGFDLLDILKDKGMNPYIIFITGKDKYAYNAIKYGASDYIKKPVLKKDLYASVQKFLNSRNEIVKTQVLKIGPTFSFNRVRFNTKEGAVFVFVKDIVYLQADNKETYVYTLQDEVVVRQSLIKVEAFLGDSGFLRISDKHLINTKYLSSFNRKRKSITLKFNGLEIDLPIPQKNMKILQLILEAV